MKNLLLISFFWLAAGLYAQPVFNRAFHSVESFIRQPLSLKGNYYFVRHQAAYGWVQPTNLVSYDSQGETRFIHSLTKFELTTIHDLQTTFDDAVVMVGIATGCDYSSEDHPVFITKVDTNGTTVFDVQITKLRYDGVPARITEAPGGDYFAVYVDSLYRVSASGSILSVKRVQNWSQISDILCIGPNRFLIGGSFGNKNTHGIIDSLGITTKTAAAYAGYYDEEFFSLPGGRTVVHRTTPAIDVLDTNLAVQNTHFLSGSGHGVSVVNDSIYIMSSGHVYDVLNSGLSLIHTFSLSVPFRSANGIALNGSRAVFTSNSSANYNQPEGLTVFPKLGGFTYDKDVGVIHADYVSATGSGFANNGGSVSISSTITPRAVVKNFGTDTIRSFVLNCLQAPPLICGSMRFHQRFDNLTILPGGTVQVTGNAFLFYSVVSGTSIPYSTILNNALYTTAPNDEIDANSANDLANVSIEVVIGLTEQAQGVELNIFPNPATSAFEWTSNTLVRNVRVFTIDGRAIQAQTPSTFNGKIDVSAFVPGLYFIKFESDSGTAIRRLVKQ